MAMMIAESAEPNNVFPIGTAQELEERKNHNRNKELFVYGFTSKDYQQPCTIMSKTFRKLSVDTKFKEATAFFEMDVDNFQDLARQYKLDVYPAFLLLNPKDNDKEVGRVTGVNPGKLESSIGKALSQLRAPVHHPPAASLDRRLGRRYPWAAAEDEQDLFGIRSIYAFSDYQGPFGRLGGRRRLRPRYPYYYYGYDYDY